MVASAANCWTLVRDIGVWFGSAGKFTNRALALRSARAIVLFSALLRWGVTCLEGPSQATIPRSSVFTIPLHHIGVEEVSAKPRILPRFFHPFFEVTKSDVKVGSCGKKDISVKTKEMRLSTACYCPDLRLNSPAQE